MLSLIYLSFSWLPNILYFPLQAVIAISFLILGMRFLKLVWDIVGIFFSFFGGILSRVVTFFV